MIDFLMICLGMTGGWLIAYDRNMGSIVIGLLMILVAYNIYSN